LKEEGDVRLSVFDAKGRLVLILVDEIPQANHYIKTWAGRDNNGRPVPAGTYFYSLEAPGWKASKQMTLTS
jgi:flagellar hook assembly protein FlgD